MSVEDAESTERKRFCGGGELMFTSDSRVVSKYLLFKMLIGLTHVLADKREAQAHPHL